MHVYLFIFGLLLYTRFYSVSLPLLSVAFRLYITFGLCIRNSRPALRSPLYSNRQNKNRFKMKCRPPPASSPVTGSIAGFLLPLFDTHLNTFWNSLSPKPSDPASYPQNGHSQVKTKQKKNAHQTPKHGRHQSAEGRLAALESVEPPEFAPAYISLFLSHFLHK